MIVFSLLFVNIYIYIYICKNYWCLEKNIKNTTEIPQVGANESTKRPLAPAFWALVSLLLLLLFSVLFVLFVQLLLLLVLLCVAFALVR